jgi:hypothetical protein
MDSKNLKDAVKTAFLEGVQEFSFNDVTYIRKGKTFTGIKRAAPLVYSAEQSVVPETAEKKEVSISKIFIVRLKNELEREMSVLKSLKLAEEMIKNEAKKGSNDTSKQLEVIIQWDNNEKYTMKYKVNHMDQYKTKPLEWRLQRELEFRSGIYQPLHYNKDQWKSHLQKISESVKLQCEKMLAVYEGTVISPEQSLVNKCIDNIQKAENTQSKMLVNQYRKKFCGLAQKNLPIEEIDRQVIADLLLSKKTTVSGAKNLIKKHSPNGMQENYAEKISEALDENLSKRRGINR